VLAEAWDRATVEDGEEATATLDLPPGRWNVSLRYDSTRPLTLSAPGYEATLPGNLDFRGPAPYWAAGTIHVPEAAEIRITAAVEEPPLAGRLLGANAVAHLGSLAATARSGVAVRAGGCGGYVDWYVPARP
jgi:hypothetical protein